MHSFSGICLEDIISQEIVLKINVIQPATLKQLNGDLNFKLFYPERLETKWIFVIISNSFHALRVSKWRYTRPIELKHLLLRHGILQWSISSVII